MSVGDVRVGPDSLLYVAQSRDGQIRVYGPDGSLVRTIGRKGEGPGEFQNILGLGLLGDTLYATDWGLNRVSLFDLEGRYLSSTVWPSSYDFETPPPYPGGWISVRAPQILLRDGSGISHTAFSQPRRPEEGGIQHLVSLSLTFHVTPDSERRDTIAWVEARQATNTVAMPAGDPAAVWCPFAWDPIGVPMADGSGAVVVDRPEPPTGTPAFRVTKIDPLGDTTSVRTVPYAPVPIDDRVLDAYVDGLRSRYTERDRAAPSPSAIRDALREIDCLPESLPPITAIVTSQDGTIWLPMSSAEDDAIEWRVLDPDGRAIGRVSIPGPAVVETARGDILVTREVDDLGVNYLTVYRMERR